MRQKKIKYVDLELMQKKGVKVTPEIIDSKESKLYVEIGSGKGRFITALAKDNPSNLYVAIEKNINVCYRIVEKKEELKLDNLIIILDDSEKLLEYFNPKSIDTIYLNFSDPWPKARHHKRRLTYPNFLNLYKEVLKDKGMIQFRTDHIDLFNDSIEYFKKQYDILNINYNHISNEYSTEYEEKKKLIGTINQLEARVK